MIMNTLEIESRTTHICQVGHDIGLAPQQFQDKDGSAVSKIMYARERSGLRNVHRRLLLPETKAVIEGVMEKKHHNSLILVEDQKEAFTDNLKLLQQGCVAPLSGPRLVLIEGIGGQMPLLKLTTDSAGRVVLETRNGRVLQPSFP